MGDLDLFSEAESERPPMDLTRCPNCGRLYGACDRNEGRFNHPTGYHCTGCQRSATTCQWCMTITMPPCTPQIHEHHDARERARFDHLSEHDRHQLR